MKSVNRIAGVLFKRLGDAHLWSQAEGRLKGGPARAGMQAGLLGTITARLGEGVSTLCALISFAVLSSCRQRGCGLLRSERSICFTRK